LAFSFAALSFLSQPVESGGASGVTAKAWLFQAAENLNKLLGFVPESLWWLFGAGYLGYTRARSFDKWREPGK
jgi:hypothetical protein